MGEGLLPPGEAVDRLKGRVGEPLAVRLLSDRRGSRVWKIDGPRGAVVLKANDPEGDSAGDKAAETAQEDVHLVRLIDAGAVDPGYRVDAGAWAGGRWLAARWVEGAPVWEAFARARAWDGDTRDTRAWLLGVARTWADGLARMHAVGWAHADVQPTNTLVTPGGRAVLIDYALACGPGDGPRLPYRGALTHTTAPEIADAVLATTADVHVRAEPPADVWGLGASLFWCWTGRRPIAYEDGVERREKLAAIAKGSTYSLSDVRPWPFPQFEDVISACLAPAPGQRPTAAAVVDRLTR
ncbi:hypothetical protein KV205_34350 [Streptomyces sp. SKN60]|uniref:protein kinase domain-containing protein n=1 Tax=Streptomyces sp. SKN60 TaxID=2855506 RepID=UPI00224616C0|nr:hypothetical protein [Streptomyces sp. SKN60]MCX2185554.1 hypothetical protein [Streptomyces sp. SKN60]